jgi:hypothetical protein
VTYDNGGLVFNDLAIGRIDAHHQLALRRHALRNREQAADQGSRPILTYQLSAAAMAKEPARAARGREQGDARTCAPTAPSTGSRNAGSA